MTHNKLLMWYVLTLVVVSPSSYSVNVGRNGNMLTLTLCCSLTLLAFGFVVLDWLTSTGNCTFAAIDQASSLLHNSRCDGFSTVDKMEKGNDEVEKLKSKFVSAWHNVKYSKCGLLLLENKQAFVKHSVFQLTITRVTRPNVTAM